MDANHALAESLRQLGPRLEATGCRWTVIASAAVALHTGDAAGIGDLDVLVDADGAAAAFAALGLPLLSGKPSDRFRSRWFGRWQAPPLAVELFAGFELFAEGGWQPVRVASRQALSFAGVPAYAPAVLELADMLRRFGRPKDLARAERLTTSARFPSR